MPSILVVEDDRELAGIVSEYLVDNGYEVSVEERGDASVQRIIKERPDAVILDVNLPGMDGFTVCRTVRPLYDGAILILTARSEDVDEVLGLEFGADDYLSKPVRPRVLLARLKTHLRRSPTTPSSEEQGKKIGGLEIFMQQRRVMLRGRSISISNAEFDLLKYLAERAGSTVSRVELFEGLNGTEYDPQDRSIDLRISRLRRKLDDDPAQPSRIRSVRGTGYMLCFEP